MQLRINLIFASQKSSFRFLSFCEFRESFRNSFTGKRLSFVIGLIQQSKVYIRACLSFRFINRKVISRNSAPRYNHNNLLTIQLPGDLQLVSEPLGLKPVGYGLFFDR